MLARKQVLQIGQRSSTPPVGRGGVGSPAVRATLFGVAASHPTRTAELMLERKRIPFRRIDFVPALHRVILRALGFQGVTVPALKLDGQRLQGSRTIGRALDALVPDPPLYPRDPEKRELVERAELWGDEMLQSAVRRLAWASLR